MSDTFRWHIGYDFIGDVKVSTIWLFVDLSVDGLVPQHYETMIFGGEHNGYQERYTTEEDARKGHERAVAMVRGNDRTTE